MRVYFWLLSFFISSKASLKYNFGIIESANSFPIFSPNSIVIFLNIDAISYFILLLSIIFKKNKIK